MGRVPCCPIAAPTAALVLARYPFSRQYWSSVRLPSKCVRWTTHVACCCCSWRAARPPRHGSGGGMCGVRAGAYSGSIVCICLSLLSFVSSHLNSSLLVCSNNVSSLAFDCVRGSSSPSCEQAYMVHLHIRLFLRCGRPSPPPSPPLLRSCTGPVSTAASGSYWLCLLLRLPAPAAAATHLCVLHVHTRGRRQECRLLQGHRCVTELSAWETHANFKCYISLHGHHRAPFGVSEGRDRGNQRFRSCCGRGGGDV